MKRHPSSILFAAIMAAAATVPAFAQTTGFNQTGAGPFDYDTNGNWVSGTINGIWNSDLTLTATQAVTFDSDLVLSTGLSFGYTGNQALTLRGDGTNRTITLGGDITVAPASNQTVTIGSTTSGQNLNVNLGGNRTFNISSGRTIRIYNTVSGGDLTINGNNSSTAAGGSMILNGDAAAAASSALSVTRGAALSFDSTASGSTGTTRAQSLQLAGGTLAITGNAGANSTETIIGALTVAPGHGYNSVTLTPNAGTHLQLNAGSLVRSGTGAALFRGTNLGVNSIASTTTGSANIAFSAAPTAQLVGGALGTKGAGILPWAVVDTSATGVGSSFATYDATNGIRALNASEYSTTIATDGSTDGHNIKLTATGTPLTVNGATTVNSLFVDTGATGAHTALDGTGSLTVTSGAVFFNIASMTGSNGASINIAKNIDFGATQGVIGTSSSTNQRRVTFTGGISGTGGVVFYDTASNLLQATGIYLGSANTYSGDTHINGVVSVAVNNALANFSNNSRTGDVYLNGVLKLITANTSIQINGLWGSGTVHSEYTNANKTLVVGDNNATSTFDGRIAGGNGSINLAKIGTGTLTLTGTNSAYAGTTAVRNGTLSAVTLNSVTGGTAASSLGTPVTIANGTIALGSTTTAGNLKVTGTGETTDRVINLAGTTGGAGIEQAGIGLLKFTSSFTATGGGSKTLTLSGSTAGTGEIAGAIVDNSLTNKTSLTKTGTGTWTLSGANTYSGNTTVSAGTLTLDTAGSLTFYIGANGVTNSVSGTGTANFNGSFNFNLTGAALVEGNSWTIVNNGTLTESFAGSFVVNGFTEAGNIWTNGSGLSFNEATGILSYSAVPEPSSFALLAGAAGLFFVASRRVRNRRTS